MRALALSVALFLALAAAPARADVASASAGSFVIQAQADVTASPERAWQALTELGAWWNGAHSYSGDAGRLSLEPRAGGCWCETWGDGQSVEHGRVLMVMEHEGVRTLRVQGALGPLQEMGVSGILTFTIGPNPNGARISMTYRVSGDPGLALDQISAPVDGVLMEQFGRLTRYADTGAPN